MKVWKIKIEDSNGWTDRYAVLANNIHEAIAIVERLMKEDHQTDYEIVSVNAEYEIRTPKREKEAK